MERIITADEFGVATELAERMRRHVDSAQSAVIGAGGTGLDSQEAKDWRTARAALGSVLIAIVGGAQAILCDQLVSTDGGLSVAEAILACAWESAHEERDAREAATAGQWHAPALVHWAPPSGNPQETFADLQTRRGYLH